MHKHIKALCSLSIKKRAAGEASVTERSAVVLQQTELHECIYLRKPVIDLLMSLIFPAHAFLA